MPQAMEWSFATPITRPRFPAINTPGFETELSTIQPPNTHTGLVGSSIDTLEHQRGIGAAESKAVRHDGLKHRIVDKFTHDRRIGNFGIELLDIRRFRDEPASHLQDAVDRLMHAGRAQ